MISIKAKVVSLSGAKVQSTRYGQLKKQDVVLADPTAHIKLVLWGDYVDTLQLNKTYALNNVRVKFTKYEHYLNSPKNEEMKATEVTPYTVPLVEYEDEVGTSSTLLKTGTLWVISMEKETSSRICSRVFFLVVPHAL